MRKKRHVLQNLPFVSPQPPTVRRRTANLSKVQLSRRGMSRIRKSAASLGAAHKLGRIYSCQIGCCQEEGQAKACPDATIQESTSC